MKFLNIFITYNSIENQVEVIIEWYTGENLINRFGSGSAFNLSNRATLTLTYKILLKIFYINRNKNKNKKKKNKKNKKKKKKKK